MTVEIMAFKVSNTPINIYKSKYSFLVPGSSFKNDWFLIWHGKKESQYQKHYHKKISVIFQIWLLVFLVTCHAKRFKSDLLTPEQTSIKCQYQSSNHTRIGNNYPESSQRNIKYL